MRQHEGEGDRIWPYQTMRDETEVSQSLLNIVKEIHFDS
jgi:hypothetical protein